MFGQTEHTIDIRQIMDSGGILFVNLTRRFLSQDSARLLGTLLVNDFYLTATERPAEGARPFYLYIDECWQFINEDIGRILDECRQFGLHLILSHQHLAQLKEAGEAVYMARPDGRQDEAHFRRFGPRGRPHSRGTSVHGGIRPGRNQARIGAHL